MVIGVASAMRYSVMTLSAHSTRRSSNEYAKAFNVLSVRRGLSPLRIKSPSCSPHPRAHLTLSATALSIVYGDQLRRARPTSEQRGLS